MLKNIFTSNVRIELIRIFIENPNQEFYIRELTRLLDVQINAIRREFDNLKEIGLFSSFVKNRKKYFKINQTHILYDEIKRIIFKSDPNCIQIYEKLKDIDQIYKIILIGQFVNIDTPIDIFVVSDLESQNVINYIESIVDINVKVTVIQKEDYLYRKSINDKFICAIEEIPDKLEIISKIDL